jgi:hypothetical protein
MPARGDGKYCSHCSNIVYDFSQMDDQELLHFFNHKPGNSCGRFHNSQLHRDILPPVKRKQLFISGFNKIAAALLTLLTFKTAAARSNIKTTRPLTVLDSNYKTNPHKNNSNTIISGKITDLHGKPLANATVMFDSIQVAKSDKDGRFQFELKVVDLEFEEPNYENHNLYFSYDSMVTVVRSYHSALHSTSYLVALYKVGEGDGMYHFTGGAPVLHSTISFDLPSVVFKSNSSFLSADTKSLLSYIAFKMKSNPEVSITVNAYPGSHQHSSKARIENIKNYLVNKESISAERIRCVIDESRGDPNTVDIKVANE